MNEKKDQPIIQSAQSAHGRHIESGEDEPLLSNLSFRHPLRRYQEEILGLVDDKLQKGEREIHIVAPPGAGKTIIGLQLIANFKRPALILAPNTTIQSQWGQKLDLFLPPSDIDFGCHDIIGTHEDKPLKPVTVMTYQVLSTPGKEQEYLTKLSHRAWVDELSKGRGLSIGEAELRSLERGERLPELDPRLHPLHRLIQRPPRHAHRRRAHRGTEDLQRPQGERQTLTLGADAGGLGKAHSVEKDAADRVIIAQKRQRLGA